MDIQATLDEIIHETLPLSAAGYGHRPEVTRAHIQVQLVEKLTPLFQQVVRPASFAASTDMLLRLIDDLTSMRMSSRDTNARMPYAEAKDIAWELLRGYDDKACEIVSVSYQEHGRIVVTYSTVRRKWGDPLDRAMLTYVHHQGDPK